MLNEGRCCNVFGYISFECELFSEAAFHLEGVEFLWRLIYVNRKLVDPFGYDKEVIDNVDKWWTIACPDASSGMEAIALFAEKKDEIDLVILDMIMPGISGGKTFDRLREIDPGVPVILASGYSMDGDAANIMSRGCDTFLQKPFLMSQLSGAIKETLDSRWQQKGGQCPCEAGPDYPEYIE